MNTNMKTKTEEFEVLIPNLDGTGIGQRVKVPITLEWDDEVQQWLVTPESHELIDSTKARLIGLLLPAQLKELRERYGYTQTQMGELFQVGEKSWTRWESGKHRPSRSINLLIRALYEGEISINYLLKRAGKPPREVDLVATTLSHWFSLSSMTEMPYMVIADRSPVHVALQSGAGKSEFLAALMHQVSHHSASPWQELSLSKPTRPSKPTGPPKGYDYENAKIA